METEGGEGDPSEEAEARVNDTQIEVLPPPGLHESSTILQLRRSYVNGAMLEKGGASSELHEWHELGRRIEVDYAGKG